MGGTAGSRIAVAGAVVAAAGLVALLTAASAHAVPGNSDGATVVIEGASMRSGNVLLHGWSLSLDSFWLVDVPFYALGVALAGVRPVLVNLVPAVIATAVVVVGAAMAAEGRSRRGAVVGVVAVVGLLGLPSHALSVFLLQGPLHVGTVLFCLVAFGALRVERGGRYVVVAVAALAAGLLGDALTLGVGVLPVLVVGLAEAGRARRLAAGRWRVTAALGSVAVAVAVRAVASLLGTFAVSKTGQPATRSEVATNLGLLPRYLAALFGVRVHGFAAGGVPTGLALVHLAGIAVALGGVVAGVVALTRRRGGTPGGLDALLVVAFAADLAVFVLLTRAPLSAYARYLTGAVVFASILGARLLARASEPGARATGRSRRRWGVAHRAAAGAGIGVVAAFGAGIGVDLARPVPPRPAAELARFLAAHHLVSGIGGYWSASLVTVDSARAVRVRPVVAGPAGLLERYPHNSRRSWYAMQPFRFLVYRPTVPFGNVDEETATRTFGPPSRHYEVAGYRVLVWPQPVYVPLGPGPAGSGPDMPRSGAAG